MRMENIKKIPDIGPADQCKNLVGGQISGMETEAALFIGLRGKEPESRIPTPSEPHNMSIARRFGLKHVRLSGKPAQSITIFN